MVGREGLLRDGKERGRRVADEREGMEAASRRGALPHPAWTRSVAGGQERCLRGASPRERWGRATGAREPRGRRRRVAGGEGGMAAAPCVLVLSVVAVALLGAVARADGAPAPSLELPAGVGPGASAGAGAAAGNPVAGQLQRAHQRSVRGRSIMQATAQAAAQQPAFSSSRAKPKTSGGMGQGLVSLLVLYIFLFLSVGLPSFPHALLRQCLVVRACGAARELTARISLASDPKRLQTNCCVSPLQCFLGCNIRDGWKLYCPTFCVVRVSDGHALFSVAVRVGVGGSADLDWRLKMLCTQ